MDWEFKISVMYDIAKVSQKIQVLPVNHPEVLYCVSPLVHHIIWGFMTGSRRHMFSWTLYCCYYFVAVVTSDTTDSYIPLT